MSESKPKVVLAYSGGLDTTCILFWLKEQGYDVICFLADLGQKEDFEAVRQQALSLGASKAFVKDCQKEFVVDYIYPAVSFGTIYQERYLLGTSLARPCIVKGLVEVARQEKAQFIAHGATGKGNDQVRFELGCASLCPEIQIIAPWRLPVFYERFAGRKDLLEYAKQNGFTTPASTAKPYSIDANLMHISYESGVLEDPFNEPPESMFAWTANPCQVSPTAKPTVLKVTFENGLPTEVFVENQDKQVREQDSLQMMHLLNQLAAEQGVGRIDIVEDRFIGLKSRGVYETPGATVLFAAVTDLRTVCVDKEVNKIRQQLAVQFAEKVYNGMWFSPEAQYLRHCLQTAQNGVSGQVRLALFAGSITILGRKAVRSLYNQEMSSMDEHGDFTPTDATGFIRTQAIRLITFNSATSSN